MGESHKNIRNKILLYNTFSFKTFWNLFNLLQFFICICPCVMILIVWREKTLHFSWGGGIGPFPRQYFSDPSPVRLCHVSRVSMGFPAPQPCGSSYSYYFGTILTPFTEARTRHVHVNAFLCHLAWPLPPCKHAQAHANVLQSPAMGWSVRLYSAQPGLPWDKAHANAPHSPVGAVYGRVHCQPGRFHFLFGPGQQVPPLTISFSSERVLWKNRKLGLSAP